MSLTFWIWSIDCNPGYRCGELVPARMMPGKAETVRGGEKIAKGLKKIVN